jgi:hypothetical protein
MHKEIFKYGLIIQVREVIWKTFNGDEVLQNDWIEEFLLIGFLLCISELDNGLKR